MKKILILLLTIASLAGCTINNQPSQSQEQEQELTNQTVEAESFNYSKYKTITVDGCSLSGERKPNVRVDIGYGDREYWAYTNEYGQLIRVEAKEVILQDDYNEDTQEGRYCSDEAKVPGTESSNYDEGHVIADSLGGYSNAYNITPQDSTLNRHGDQAYMEKMIREAGGCTDFIAEIKYSDNETQIPSHYKYTYTLKGNVIIDEFDNINPDLIPVIDNQANNDPINVTYILNINSKKFHLPTCESINKISEKNRKDSDKSRDELISEGFEPCKSCNP